MKFLEKYKLILGAISGTIAILVLTWPYQPIVLAQRIDDLEIKNKELEDYTVSHIKQQELDSINAQIRMLKLIPEDQREEWQVEQLLILQDRKEIIITGLKEK